MSVKNMKYIAKIKTKYVLKTNVLENYKMRMNTIQTSSLMYIDISQKYKDLLWGRKHPASSPHKKLTVLCV